MFKFSYREVKGGREVDCRFGVNDVGAREDEREDTSRVVGGDQARDDKAETPGYLCSLMTPDEPSIRRYEGDIRLLQWHWGKK